MELGIGELSLNNPNENAWRWSATRFVREEETLAPYASAGVASSGWSQRKHHNQRLRATGIIYFRLSLEIGRIDLEMIYNSDYFYPQNTI
jgi:hypothetical protein